MLFSVLSQEWDSAKKKKCQWVLMRHRTSDLQIPHSFLIKVTYMTLSKSHTVAAQKTWLTTKLLWLSYKASERGIRWRLRIFSLPHAQDVRKTSFSSYKQNCNKITIIRALATWKRLFFFGKNIGDTFANSWCALFDSPDFLVYLWSLTEQTHRKIHLLSAETYSSE